MSNQTIHGSSGTTLISSLLAIAVSVCTACTIDVPDLDPLTSGAGEDNGTEAGTGDEAEPSTDTETGAADEVGTTETDTDTEETAEETDETGWGSDEMGWESGASGTNCAPGDPYCPLDGCPETMGEEVIIDIDDDGDADFSWCRHECLSVEFCPTGEDYGPHEVQCVELSGGSKACIPTCEAMFSSCPDPAVCSDIAGPELCLYGNGLP